MRIAEAHGMTLDRYLALAAIIASTIPGIALMLLARPVPAWFAKQRPKVRRPVWNRSIR